MSVHKDIMKLSARVLEYDIQFLDAVRAAPARTQGKFGIFLKRKNGGTRLCIPRDENDNFSLAVFS